jgi:hypothetical protein
MQSTGVCPAQPFCTVGTNTERHAHFLLQNFVMIDANQVLGGGALHFSENGSAQQLFPLGCAHYSERLRGAAFSALPTQESRPKPGLNP